MEKNDIIKFNELKFSFCSMFRIEFNIHSFLSTFLMNSIFVFQMYYFSYLKDLQEKYFGFFMGYILYKLTQILTLYYQSCYLKNVQILYLNKNYTEMNILYKKTLINSIIIHIISFFPLKWGGIYILKNIYLIRQHPNFAENSLLKVEQYINFHFWVSLIACLTNAITQILLLLNYNNVVTCGNILRFLINIFFSVFYWKKYEDEYFVKGLSFADLIGEIFVGIYLIIIKCKFIDLSQNDLTSFNNYVEELNLKNFIYYFLIYFYDESFIILYVFFFVKNYEISYFNFFFMCFIFKNMFFKIPRKDEINILMFYKNIYYESSENINNELNSKFLMSKNYEWMLFIKEKTIKILILNIIIALLYFVFYLCKGFQIIDINEKNLLLIILFGINGIIEQLGLFIINTEKIIIYSSVQSFYIFFIGFILSFISFFFIIKATHSITGGVAVIYITFYYIFFKVYPIIKNSDTKLFNINKILFKEENNRIDLCFIDCKDKYYENKKEENNLNKEKYIFKENINDNNNNEDILYIRNNKSNLENSQYQDNTINKENNINKEKKFIKTILRNKDNHMDENMKEIKEEKDRNDNLDNKKSKQFLRFKQRMNRKKDNNIQKESNKYNRSPKIMEMASKLEKQINKDGKNIEKNNIDEGNKSNFVTDLMNKKPISQNKKRIKKVYFANE